MTSFRKTTYLFLLLLCMGGILSLSAEAQRAKGRRGRYSNAERNRGDSLKGFVEQADSSRAVGAMRGTAASDTLGQILRSARKLLMHQLFMKHPTQSSLLKAVWRICMVAVK